MHRRLIALGEVSSTMLRATYLVGGVTHNTLLAVAYAIAQLAKLLISLKLVAPHSNIVVRTLCPAHILAQDDKVGNKVELAIAVATSDA